MTDTTMLTELVGLGAAGAPLEPMLRLLLAALLGMVVGWERERHGRAAGLRTHMLLCTGCALIMLVSLQVPALFAGSSSQGIIRADPGRIAGHALSGLGFLGAGAILVLGTKIRGLTTAASIWITAAIGLSVGLGLIGPAAFAWLITMFALLVMSRLEKRMERKDHYVRLELRFSRPARRMEELRDFLESRSFQILQCLTGRSGREITYRMVLRHQFPKDFEQITDTLTETFRERGLEAIEWKE